MSTFATLTKDHKLELWACLALRHTTGLGVTRANALIQRYGTALEAVKIGRNSPVYWVNEGLVSSRIATVFSKEAWRTFALKEWQLLQEQGCFFTYRTQSTYPSLLAETLDAPLLLYYQGDMSLFNNPTIGIVGSRNCSEEGIRVCAFFARALSAAGITIISGMAKGIDRAAHISALSEVGSSIAVLGTGISTVYPPSNQDLYEALVEEGLVITEFAPGTSPNAKNFPIRNRVISGLSKGVVIVEASKRSGSLITARLALEQNREVFVVPGNTLSAQSEGCHELIRSGAKPVFTAEDILVELLPLLTEDMQKILTSSTEKKKDATFEKEGFVLPEKIETNKKGLHLSLLYQTDIGNSRKSLEKINSNSRKNEHKKLSPQQGEFSVQLEKVSAKKKQHLCSLNDASFEALVSTLSDAEKIIIQLLRNENLHIDAIVERTAFDAATVSSTLVMLELQDVVIQLPGMIYQLGS